MKNYLLLIGTILSGSLLTHAQNSNAILFAENGERFQVVLNGVLQNSKPETNVKMTGLAVPNYKCRILFEDKSLGYLDFNIFFPNPPQEVTWNIKKNKKGEFVTRPVSWIPIEQAPPPPPTQTVIVYSTTPPPVETTTTVQQTTMTTTTGGSSNGTNVNMGVSVNDAGGGMNVQVSGMDPATTSTSVTTTTTQTTTVTSTSAESPEPSPAHLEYVSGYSGPVGCPAPMKHGDFESLKSSIQSKSFEESKLTMAKQVLNNNCLTSAQVREVMQLFSFEDSKLNFAKHAYSHTYDTGNYFKVNDAFTFESSIEELNNYINNH